MVKLVSNFLRALNDPIITTLQMSSTLQVVVSAANFAMSIKLSCRRRSRKTSGRTRSIFMKIKRTIVSRMDSTQRTLKRVSFIRYQAREAYPYN